MLSIALIRWRSIISRHEPPGLSSHFVKSSILTSCSTRTVVTETFTVFKPSAIPATHEFHGLPQTLCNGFLERRRRDFT